MSNTYVLCLISNQYWWSDPSGVEEKESDPRDLNELSGDGSIENMLVVEKGMRELASLKIEDAVMLELALRRRSSSIKSGTSGENSEE